MGWRGEEVVRIRFTAEAMVSNLVDVYQGLLADKEAR
jgi:hypothetical protein